MALDLSQAKSIQTQQVKGPYCHYSLKTIPDPSALSQGMLAMIRTMSDCLGKDCVNWDAEEGKCGDVVIREQLKKLAGGNK